MGTREAFGSPLRPLLPQRRVPVVRQLAARPSQRAGRGQSQGRHVPGSYAPQNPGRYWLVSVVRRRWSSLTCIPQ